ncbi:unnamed protein product [Musa banksii]
MVNCGERVPSFSIEGCQTGRLFGESRDPVFLFNREMEQNWSGFFVSFCSFVSIWKYAGHCYCGLNSWKSIQGKNGRFN